MLTSIVNSSQCRKYDCGFFLLSPDFFQQDKLTAWDLLSSSSTHSCFHYFDCIKDIVASIEDKVLCYDLTDGLPKFFEDGFETGGINSSKKIARVGDFAISRLRSYLQEMGIVEKRTMRQLFSTEFLIFRSKTNEISTHTLFALCMTTSVQTILSRGQYGTEHPRFYDFLLTNLPIPNCLLNIDKYVSNIVVNAIRIRNRARNIYEQAQNILLSELGLIDWHPQHRLTFIKNYSDTQQAQRIDAEYFQPKYDEVIKAIKNYSGGWDTLGNLCDTKRGSLIPDRFYSNTSGTFYVRGADFSMGILSSDKGVYINNDFQYESETTVKTNEIVFSLIGSVGETALVTQDFNNSYISNNIGKITCQNKSINPFVVQVMLQSTIGKLFFEKYKMQTAQPKISDKDVRNFLIAILPIQQQEKIQQHITKFFELRERSRYLLECAKRAVEIAIEQNEKVATDWLQQHTKNNSD